MRSRHLTRLVLPLAVAAAALLSGCYGNTRDCPEFPGTGEPFTFAPGKSVTLDEARACLPYEPVLPADLPDGVSHQPEFALDGDTLWAMYWEDPSPPPETHQLRFRLMMDPAQGTLAGSDDIVTLRGVRVGLLADHWESGEAILLLDWHQDGVWYEAEFGWLTDGEVIRGPVTDDMRAEALRVVESMIAQAQER